MKKQSMLMGLMAITTVAGAAFVPAPYGDVRLKGPMGERLDKMIANHVFATDTAYITAPFLEKTERHGWWHTEFWGKYMHAAAPYWTLTGSAPLKSSIEVGLANILRSQEPSGYIGNYPDELRCGGGWDVWGMKYSLMGLMHYYDAVKDTPDAARGQKALDAACRLCDYVISQLGPNGARGRAVYQTGSWCGFASSSILEPVVWLHRRVKASGDAARAQKYLDFATFIVKGMTEPPEGPRLLDLALKGVSVADRNDYGNKPNANGGYPAVRNRTKAYEMMSCYQGLLDYAEETGRKDLVAAAVATCDQILRDEINIAGGSASSEAWFHGASKQHLPYVRLQETCVTTTWMRFVEKLLDVTGDPKYADALEQTFYNIYLASMNRDGSVFAAYTPLNGYRSNGHHHCYMHTNCCNANGPRGFLAFLRSLFQTDGERAVMNFYASGSAHVKLPKTGRTIAFDSYTLYPKTGYVRLTNHTVEKGDFTLALRIPAWSANTSVRVNGKPVPGVKAGAYLDLARTWTIGDVVEIDFDLAVRVHELDHYLAFTRGPIALARDTRFGDGPIDEVFRPGSVNAAHPPAFKLVRSPDENIWMTFSAVLPVGSHHEDPDNGVQPSEVHFCDYASAGDLWQPSNAYRTWFPVEYLPSK